MLMSGMGELTAKGHEGTFEGDENVLYLDFGGVTYVSAFVKTHQPLHLKWVHFTVCEL